MMAAGQRGIAECAEYRDAACRSARRMMENPQETMVDRPEITLRSVQQRLRLVQLCPFTELSADGRPVEKGYF
jgi:hypothetical protein